MLKYIVKQPKPSNSNYEFKMRYTFEKRKDESTRLMLKYPDKILIVVEKSDSSDVQDISQHKWMIKQDLTFGQFIHILRLKIKLDNPKDALIFFVDNIHIPSTSSTIEDVYKKYKDKDGFLYITYSKEEVYGY